MTKEEKQAIKKIINICRDEDMKDALSLFKTIKHIHKYFNISIKK